MSYQSPVDIIMGQMQTKIEGEVYSAVQRIGINVDKDELLKALKYDRGQYEKGYKDRDSEIVLCKDCKFFPNGDGSTTWLPCIEIITPPGWFCADWKRRDG